MIANLVHLGRRKTRIHQDGPSIESSNGKQNGDGDFRFPNGDHYVGQMKDGLMDGKGRLTFASGDVYIGEFKNDKANGQGTVRLYAVAVSHSGVFKDGCLKDGDEVVSISQSTMDCALKLDK